jgi:alpha-galactosidase
MSIIFDGGRRMFLLHTNETSYVMRISNAGYLCHVYWGKKIRDIHPEEVTVNKFRALSPVTDITDKNLSLDTVQLEYPAYGNSDFRNPAFQVQFADGSTVCNPKYKDYKIFKGKPALDGLPSTYTESDGEADTLEIVLEDELSHLQITLLYTAFKDFNTITRSVLFKNNGTENIKILKALSMSVDMRRSGYDMLQLSGAWARERHIYKRPLVPGMQSVESRRGASSAQQNPFIALLSKGADEKSGDVYAVNLVYSGNFFAGAEVDQYATTRLSAGINQFDFTWLLEPGQSFQTPEAVMVYSDKGLGKMSRTFHKLYRERLCRGKFKDKERPILVNNWEATCFDFDSERILNIAKAAARLGVELFVLDDGWFGKRDSDDSSLGDWFTNKKKIPEGLDGLAASVNKLGLKFGLWFEPEMVSKNSDLYRKHPDWCIHVEGRDRTESRNQLVLDFSRDDVCDEIEKMLTDVISSAPIYYIKWDMNRNITEAGSSTLEPDRQREIFHRYILGLYKLLDRITRKFPDILFESCASGGGRFDPGMLYYMPQTWTSDDTDAIERLKIQYGTSLVYPASSMAAHVSAVPNQQVSRTTPFSTRGNAAMLFNFGYELDLSKLSKEECDLVKEQIAAYKGVRKIVQYGDMYRLRSPFEGNNAACIYVLPDKTEAFAVYFNILGVPNSPLDFIRFDGLDEDKQYEDIESGRIYGGDELMNSGLPVSVVESDFQSQSWHFKIKQ